MFFMFCGLNVIYTIIIDKSIFDNTDVYIGNWVVYVIIAYKLPTTLPIITLINLGFIFKIIAVAYKIIVFITKFSKNIISI